MALDRRGAELLFQVLTEREEKNSVAIASNESFGGWTKTFTDPRLCGAGRRDRRRAGWAYSRRTFASGDWRRDSGMPSIGSEGSGRGA